MWALIFVGPHLFGGRHLLGRFAILSLCVVAGVAWFARQLFVSQAKWNSTRSLAILFAALAVVVLQLVPLPAKWLAAVTPRTAEILPLWSTENTAMQLGQWRTISLAPEETRLALATLVAYVLLFLTTVQRVESIDDIKRLMRWMGYSAVVVAGFGIVQYFTANGKYFWFYEYSYTDTLQDVKAGFTSRNHFAHFLVLGLACLLATLVLSRGEGNSRRKPRPTKGSFTPDNRSSSVQAASTLVLTLGLTLVVFAILASLSRGGMLAMVSAAAVAAAIYARAGILHSTHVVAGGFLIVLLMAALTLSGNYEHIAERMETLTSQSSETVDDLGGRREIWMANVAAFREGSLSGSGAGSHRFIYPLYARESTKEYTHAENGYLQIATENGLPGILLLIATIGTCVGWCLLAIRNADGDRQLNIIIGGLAAALTASAVHSAVDFVWFIPACMTITILVAACTLRMAQLTAPASHHARAERNLATTSKWNMALTASLAGVWAMLTLLPAARSSLEWDSYHLADEALRTTGERKSTATETDLAQLAESEQLNSDSMLVHLAKFVEQYPNSALGHVRLASALLNRFDVLQLQADNPLPVNQIREAVQAGGFSSSEQLRDWLKVAIGENSRLLYRAFFHARRAVQLCPLQGEAYLYLAELCFLEGRGPAAFEALTKQALLVRPYDVDVLYAVGKNLLIAHNNDEALKFWSSIYHKTGKHQREIIQILAPNMEAVNFLKVFQPDWSTLKYVWRGYRQLGTTEPLNVILPYAERLAREQAPHANSSNAAVIWLELSSMQVEMNNPQGALQSLKHAYSANPENFAVRYECGSLLFKMKQYELAEPHLRWCLTHVPDNEGIKVLLKQCSRVKMERLATNSRTITQ